MCVVCGFPEVHARQRCRTCYRYQRAHGGTDRTEEMVVRAELRRMEMEEYRRRIRLAAGWSA